MNEIFDTEIKDKSTINLLREHDEHSCCKQNSNLGGRDHNTAHLLTGLSPFFIHREHYKHENNEKVIPHE
jgi:hypothetical protein